MEETKVVHKKKVLAPKLRFKGFENSWASEKIGNIINNKSPKYNPEKAKESFKCIELEHLSSSTGELLGYIDSINSASIKNKFNTGDVLFGKLRPYLKKYLIAPFEGVCSSEIWVLKGEKITNEFLYQIVQSDFFINLANQSTGSKMPRADWNVVASGMFTIPSLPEQQKIASFLSAVDEKIQLLNRKKQLLEQYKKGVMQQLFSGKLRFKPALSGVEGDENGKAYPKWEEKKLGEISSINTGSSNRQDSGLDGEYTFFDRSQDIRTSSIFLFDGETIIVAGEGQEFIPKYYIGKFDLHQRTYAIMNYKNAIGKYLFYYIFYNRHYFFSQSVGSTVRSLRLPMFQKMNIKLPHIEEQKKIADFLSAIDVKIESLSKQINQTQNFKKGLLQQMFV